MMKMTATTQVDVGAVRKQSVKFSPLSTHLWLASKTWKILIPIHHHLYQQDNFVPLSPQGHKRLDT